MIATAILQTNLKYKDEGRIKMKKLLALSAIASALCANVHAETKENDKWVAGFIEDYSTDNAETGAPNFLENGVGLGAEFGFKFTPQWAIRIESSHLDIDASPTDESGSRVGVDVLYFLPNDLLYVFGGLKNTYIVDGDAKFNIGLGKHWDLSDSIKIITEVAAYQPLASDNSNTHVGLKFGFAYAFGGSGSSSMLTSKDSDNDGVFDNTDKCANTPVGTRVGSDGCALDSDGDGVLNSLDMCADTSAGTKVGAKGCSLILDADQDGILDAQDKCADTPMSDKIDAMGCSVFTDKEVSVNLQVLFGNNSVAVSNPDDAQFKQFADFMQRFPATDTVIEGHASAAGNDDYNMMLSQQRAEAVRTLFVDKYGIDASRLTAKGLGETQLLDTSNTAQAHKTNRRITAKITASDKVKVQR
jgi:OOP family OmpA-OmpF porin